MAIALADLLNPNHVDLDLRTRGVEIAFRKIMRLLAADEQIGDQEKFLQQVLARERESPSVVEQGVAFPHARTDLVNKIVLGIGRSRAGIPFAKSGRARLIFLIGVPQRLVNDYRVCVGALARVLKDDIIRNRLLSVETPQEFITILREADQDPLAASA
jgi:mannitol/fructose-specific phosphotransferase system IIA component (Ntr-type)